MPNDLSAAELVALVGRVFKPGDKDRAIAVLVDLPDSEVPDNPHWRERRLLAADWAGLLAGSKKELGLDCDLVLYRNTRMNNADLPERAWIASGDLPDSADALDPAESVSTEAILSSHSILLAPTEFSATAPLKIAAPSSGFRAATMPGFAVQMIPTLRLDYTEINRRVAHMKKLLDRASYAEIEFLIDAHERRNLRLDLRHRTAHASGGLFPDPGTAGNLPSGEAYIVPYEGELEQDPSQSAGELPVQFGDEIVVFNIEENVARSASGPGAAAREQAELLAREPAYGNLAELGLGVLSDFGIEPCGSVLLDEKLGLHIAFGRSDHFGGQVGAKQFSRPEAVVHIDRVYIPSLQPRVLIERADLLMPDGSHLPLIRRGEYVINLNE
ncbi:MAG TPA: hypothetical protein VM425_06215 [Myxococcota bacterium]|nr:hypothetical protein [Myxococcota bacterium]